MWFMQDTNDILARTKNCCRKNLPGSGHELVETGYLDHICWVSKSWCFGFENVVLGGWLGNNLPGLGHELVSNGYLDHLCRVLKSWCFGLGNIGFGGWLGNYQNFIFRNAIKIIWCDNMPGVGHELVEMGHLDYLCWVSKNWWVRLGRLGFGCWLGDLRKSIIFNIIVWGGNSNMTEYTFDIFNELVK